MRLPKLLPYGSLYCSPSSLNSSHCLSCYSSNHQIHFCLRGLHLLLPASEVISQEIWFILILKSQCKCHLPGNLIPLNQVKVPMPQCLCHISVFYFPHSSHCFPSLSSLPRMKSETMNVFAMFTCFCCLSWYLDAIGIKSVFVEGKVMIAGMTLSMLTHIN